jgi:uncharacterized membrane protein
MPLHLFIVHFPVALLITGAAADLGGAVLRSERTRAFAGVLLIAGGACAFLAFLTGGGALSAALSRISPVDPRLEVHQQWGAAGVWLLLGAAGLRLAWHRRLDGARGWIALAAALASAAVVTGIALSGAAISHGG